MSEDCKISGFRILKVDFNISGLTRGCKSGITLKVEDKISCRKPSNSSDKTALIEIDTNIISDEVADLRLSLLSQAIFCFAAVPKVLVGMLQTVCYPIARDKVYEAIKKITEAMGISALDLNNGKN